MFFPESSRTKLLTCPFSSLTFARNLAGMEEAADARVISRDTVLLGVTSEAFLIWAPSEIDLSGLFEGSFVSSLVDAALLFAFKLDFAPLGRSGADGIPAGDASVCLLPLSMIQVAAVVNCVSSITYARN